MNPMGYEVTANRKRPKSFDGLVGQEFVVSSLSNSLATGRIAHAYLFSGPRGVGKTSAARILARALNCPGGPSTSGCPDYPGADEISRGTSMDVIEIDGASNTSVNDVRAIKDEVLFPPQSSKYKIYIIDEVHMLSNSAFNALLKTIEEPPPYIIFIFATTEVHKVPATIRSRCQQFNFRQIPREEIVKLLAEAAQELGISAEPDALLWIAKEATGSLRDAFTLFDQVASFSGTEMRMETIREKLGVLGHDRIDGFAQLLVAGDSRAAVEAFDEFLSAGISLEQLVVDLAEYFRGLLLLKSGIQREGLLGFQPESVSNLVVEGLSLVQIERLLELLLELHRNLRFTMNARFDFEVWISKACKIRSYLSPAEVMEQLDELRASMAPGGTGLQEGNGLPAKNARLRDPEQQARVVQPASPRQEGAAAQVESSKREKPRMPDPAPAHSSPELVDEGHRKTCIAAIRRENITVASSLEKSSEWRLLGNELRLKFEAAMPARLVSENLKIVEDAVSRELMPGLRVKVELARDQQRPQANQPEAAPAPAGSAGAQIVAEIFRGTIVEPGGTKQ